MLRHLRFFCKSLITNRAGMEGPGRLLTFLPPDGHNGPVITCTKCGAKNSDDTLACARCGNKLQSSRRAASGPDATDAPLEPFRHEGVPGDLMRSLKRMLEAWAYALLLGGVAAACIVYKIWWPLYPTVVLIALLLWLRRV
ncbi:MAG: zinc ribbon domain-containing protein [Pseudodesulfovibrio sp.]|uniref:zinc ribbon domain-containing protein n=1 Tax=Pseudodesulfovibrio sp. TaxID=2035812 RepID=UPI003D0ECAB8